MAAKPHGTRVLGQQHIYLMTGNGSTTLAAKTLVQSIEATGSNTVDAAATNTAVFGFTKESIAATATGLCDRIQPGDLFWVSVSSGTVASTLMGKYGDIVNGLSVTTTNSNNDCRFMGWDGATTNFAIVEFETPESATPTILA